MAVVQCGPRLPCKSSRRSMISTPKNGAPTTTSLRLRSVGSVVPARPVSSGRGKLVVMAAGLKELRERITSVKNSAKITSAMKLVAAARVRRAQEEVLVSRPYHDKITQLMFEFNDILKGEDVTNVLTTVRPVKSVMLLCMTGERGLCGAFNASIIKKTEDRYRELTSQGVECGIYMVGKKARDHFTNSANRDKYKLVRYTPTTARPSGYGAAIMADYVTALFVNGTFDKVEIVFSKFVSLIKSTPTVRTFLPMTSTMGEMCDLDGNCIDAADDEMFKLTTNEGKLAVERFNVYRKPGQPIDTGDGRTTIPLRTLGKWPIFESPPASLFDAILPMYLNGMLLRSLQESLASELAARMQAMAAATDNANALQDKIRLQFNRQRQAKITSELIEIVSGAAASE